MSEPERYENEDCPNHELLPILLSIGSAAFIGYFFGRTSRKDVVQVIAIPPPEEWLDAAASRERRAP